jgi:DNA primase
VRGRIRAEDIEEVRRRANLVEVAAEYMQVRKAGATRYKALCPFHQEKTPSLSMDAAKGLWTCFGCGKGGDVITLVSELEGLEFVETVERLAARVGVRLTYERVSAAERAAATRKQRLVAAHREATAFYHDLLLGSSEAEEARRYLRSRGVTRSSVETFRLGWAPARRDALVRHLLRRRFTEAELVEGGLALRAREGGLVDRFRGRIMFPILDVAGEPVGFGGRVLGEGTPKYLNSAETPVFHKGRVLYGLSLAKKAVAASGRAVVVEGYMDVIACHQAGVTEAVATNGTALTLDHFRLLGRFAPAVVVAFDSDRAGAAAVERAFDAALASGLDVRVLVLPEGKDPAEAVAARGGEAFRRLVEEAVPIVEYRLRREIARFDLSGPEGRARAVRASVPILARLDDPVMRRDYTARLAEWTREDPDVVFLAVGRASGDRAARAAPTIRRASAEVRLERDVLKLALQYPAAIAEHAGEVREEMFSVPAHRAIWRELAAGRAPAAVADALADEEARRILSALANEPIACDLEPDGRPPRAFVRDAVARMKEFALRRIIQERKAALERLNPLRDEREYRRRYAELIALEGEARRATGALAETGAEVR